LTPTAAPARPREWTTWLVAAALLAAVCWAYSTSLTGVFLFDDRTAIVDNPNIRSLRPLSNALTAPADTSLAGRPIAHLTFALNYALAPADVRDVMSPGDGFLRNVRGYHLVNAAIHFAAALTLFGVVRRTFDRWCEGQAGTGRACPAPTTFIAAAIAMLWLVHPLHTESVTYLVQRVESLMGLFYLLTLYCAIRAVDSAGRSAWWMAGAFATCALGMLTKETMVTAPIVVGLWMWVFGSPASTRVSARVLPLMLATTWVIIPLVAAGARRDSAGFGLGWTWWSYLLTQAGVVTHYLRLAFVPAPLIFDYEWPKATTARAIWPYVALLVPLLAASVVLLVRRRPVGLLGVCFFLILAPSSSLLPIPSEVAAEHRMYLPLAAVIAVVVLAAASVARRWPRLTIAVVAACCLSTAALAETTRRRNLDYSSAERMWADTVAKRPESARVRVAYAIELMAAGRTGEAATHLRAALSLDPNNAMAHLNLGTVLVSQGKFDAGIERLERALVLDPKQHEALGVLGEAHLAKGEPSTAVSFFLRAIESMPGTRASRFLLNRTAFLLATHPDATVRNGAKSVELAERAVLLSGGRDLATLETLGAAYAEAGRFSDATRTTLDAISLARSLGDDRTAQAFEQRLLLYQSGRTLRR
jgi:tetratricopeptide (TPR) repeat protein